MIDENLLLEDLIYCKGLGRRGIEAVVKQIEDASVELYGFAKVVGLDKVIELVRNGGVK